MQTGTRMGCQDYRQKVSLLCHGSSGIFFKIKIDLFLFVKDTFERRNGRERRMRGGKEREMRAAVC